MIGIKVRPNFGSVFLVITNFEMGISLKISFDQDRIISEQGAKGPDYVIAPQNCTVLVLSLNY